MDKEKIICYAVSTLIAVIMTATAIAVAAFAGYEDAYIPSETAANAPELPEDSADGKDVGNPPENPGSNADDESGDVSSSTEGGHGGYPTETNDSGEDIGTGETTDEPDETNAGAGSALGKLGRDDPLPETTYETGIIVIPPETTDIATDTDTGTDPGGEGTEFPPEEDTAETSASETDNAPGTDQLPEPGPEPEPVPQPDVPARTA